MSNFTKLEKAALHAIFAETPELAAVLKQQFEQANVTSRENSGKGFFATIAVSEGVPRVNSAKVLGSVTYARITGLTYGLGFVLFLENGRLRLLDGHAVGSESTASLDLEGSTFTIRKTPFDGEHEAVSPNSLNPEIRSIDRMTR